MAIEDPFDTPEFKEYAKAVREEMLPKMTESAFVVSLMPAGGTDVKFAVELGYAIMLDKPILLIVPPGTVVPPKLRIVADRITEANLETASGRQEIKEHVEDFLGYVKALEKIRGRNGD